MRCGSRIGPGIPVRSSQKRLFLRRRRKKKGGRTKWSVRPRSASGRPAGRDSLEKFKSMARRALEANSFHEPFPGSPLNGRLRLHVSQSQRQIRQISVAQSDRCWNKQIIIHYAILARVTYYEVARAANIYQRRIRESQLTEQKNENNLPLKMYLFSVSL